MIAPQFANTREPGKCIGLVPGPHFRMGGRSSLSPPEDLPLRPAQLRFGGVNILLDTPPKIGSNPRRCGVGDPRVKIAARCRLGTPVFTGRLRRRLA